MKNYRLYLVRHGITQGNLRGIYMGSGTDEPLCEQGIAQLRELREAFPFPRVATVFSSPLKRALGSAEILFPGVPQIPVQDLREMCFGSFEGRNYVEMEHDAEYLAWVASNSETACPDGERKADFCERTCKAFAGVIDEALAKGVERLAIVAHGGTQMASLERFGRPARGYYDWCAGNGGGFVLDASRWKTDRVLDLVGTVDYGNPPAKEAQ